MPLLDKEMAICPSGSCLSTIRGTFVLRFLRFAEVVSDKVGRFTAEGRPGFLLRGYTITMRYIIPHLMNEKNSDDTIFVCTTSSPS